MAQITAQILAKLAPSTNNSTRNRFLPYLNEALPRYEITSENQVAAFLATCCFESAYFRATKEGHARPGTKARRYQDKYWDSNMMGRGLIQLTHLAGYQAFQDDVGDDAGIDVIANPALLEQPKWAVEASCWYWQVNNLNRYADQGLRGYFALQGRVNRGDPTKEALEYPTRLRLFETALRVLPDGFVLDSSTPATTAVNDGNPIPPQPLNTKDQSDPISTDTANTASADTAPDLSGDGGGAPAPAVPTEEVTLAAPPSTGAVAASTKMTIAGIAVPSCLVAVFKAISNLVTDGYIDAKDIGNTVLSFITNNTKYVLALVGLVIVLVIIKRVTMRITLWLSMLTHAIPSWNSITVVPVEPQAVKKWWRLW